MEATYSAVIGVGRIVLRALGLDVRLEGAHHVPRTGPVVLVGNHVSFLDFLLIGLAARPSGRNVRFLCRHDIWHAPLVGKAMTAMRHVPVDRAAPAAAYLGARGLLRSGEAVGVFPEAGVSTSYTVRALMPGAVALAAETGAPIVPVALWGPQRLLTAGQPRDLTRGRPVSLRVGAPILVPADADVRVRTGELGAVLQGMLDGLQTDDRHRVRPGERAPWHPAHLGGQAPDAEEIRQREDLPASAVPVSWAPARSVASARSA